MEGVLLKWTNYFTGWQTRYFVLENGILSYYHSQEDINSSCKGSIKVSACDIIAHPTDRTRLDLIVPGEAHYHLRASNQHDRQSWLVALGTCKASGNSDSLRFAMVESRRSDGDNMSGEELLKAKKSELLMFRDLLAQQLYDIKTTLKKDNPPDIELLNESTTLVSATCQSFVNTLDDCVQLVDLKFYIGSREGSASPTGQSLYIQKYKSSSSKTPSTAPSPPSWGSRPMQRLLSNNEKKIITTSRATSEEKDPHTTTSRRSSSSNSFALSPDAAVGRTGLGQLYGRQNSKNHHDCSSRRVVPVPGNACNSNSQVGSNGCYDDDEAAGHAHPSPSSLSLPTVHNDYAVEECVDRIADQTDNNNDKQVSFNNNNNNNNNNQNGGSREDDLETNFDLRLPTFFTEMDCSFVDIKITRDFEIPTVQFLDACRSLVTIFGIFDKLNQPAFVIGKLDIAGNIRKIHQKYIGSPDAYPTLQKMIATEVKRRESRDINSATVALLWLCKSLEFAHDFIVESLNHDYEVACGRTRVGEDDDGSGGAAIKEIASRVYERVLKKHHGWVVRSAFSIALSSSTTMHQLIRCLATDPRHLDDPAFRKSLRKDAEDYSLGLRSILDVLRSFFETNNLHIEVEEA